MLSAKALKVLLSLAKFAYRLGSIPFVWDETKSEMHLTKSKLKLLHWKCQFIFLCCNSIFMTVRLSQAFCCIPGISYGKLFINFFSFVTFTTTAAVHLNTYLCLGEIPRFFNEMIRLNDFFQRNLKTLDCIDKAKDKFLKKCSKAKKISKVVQEPGDPYERNIRILNQEFYTDEPRRNTESMDKRTSLIHSALERFRQLGYFHQEHQPGDSTVACMHGIIFPIYCYSISQFFIVLRSIDNPKYVYSLFDFKSTPTWKLIPFAAFECYASFSVASTLIFYVIFMLAYVKSTKWCLKRLCELKNHHQIPKYYRTLQILNIICNQVLRPILMPCLLTTTMTIILIGNYATIKLFHEVKMPAYLGFPTISLAMVTIVIEAFPTSYYIYDYSTKLLNLLLADFKGNRFSHRRGHLLKFVKSSKPLAMEVSVFFAMKRSTTITYFGIACNYTFQLLLI